MEVILTDEEIALEEWRAIPGFEGKYEASTMGRIRSLDHFSYSRNRCGKMKRLERGQIKRFALTQSKYQRVALSVQGKGRVTFPVHRLIALTFIPNPKNKPCIDHIDTNPSNNRVTNLRWCTQSENLLNEITRKKISKNTTRQMSDPVARQKISLCNKGYKHTDESRAKMSKSHSGVLLSESHRASLRLANQKIAAVRRKKIFQLSLDGEFIQEWNSLTEAGKALHICISEISACLHGKKKSAGGYKWKFNILKEDSYESNTNEPKAAMVQ